MSGDQDSITIFATHSRCFEIGSRYSF